ncbi:MAG: tetratricopeptide repeat protein, partial [Gammaproteobacteria bacterium]
LHSSPGHPEVSLNYGNLLQLEADYEPAIQVYQNALSKDPNHTLLLNGLGNAYCKTGQLEKAITPLKRATRINPNDAISWFNLANVYFQMQRIERAQKCLNRAKKIRPKKLNFFHLAGEIEEQLGHWATALETYQHALDIDPDNPTTLHKLGRCYMENHRLTDARRTLEHCLARSPHYPLAWYHLGNALRSLGQLDAASAAYRNCLQQDDQHVEARLNLALSELQQHQWQRGWRNYEVRWKLPRYQHPYDALPLPRWRGQSLAGCGIVLWGEQGVGDEILFVRVAQDLAQHAKKVVVLCNPRLQSLLQRSLPGITVIAKTATLDPVQAIPHIHFHSPLASVMHYLPAAAYLKPFSLRPNPHFTAQVP